MSSDSLSPPQLIEQCQGLVRTLALGIHRKVPPSVELDDLIAYGQVGLGEAARDFDPARGGKFSTYAYYRIRGAIYDGLAKMSWFGRSAYQHVRYEQMGNEVLRQQHDETPAGEGGDLQADMRWLRSVSRALAVVCLTTLSGRDEDRNAEAGIADESSPDGEE